MTNNSVHSFMKTSELYLRFTELKNTSFDIQKIEPYIFSKNNALNDSKKIVDNKALI